MTEIILDCSLDEARELVVKAFDRTNGINKYQKSQYQVVGETGVSFPRVLWSYGESVYVDLSETGQLGQTKLDARGKKEVRMNIGANPEKYKRSFLNELSKLREEGVSEDSTETVVEGSENNHEQSQWAYDRVNSKQGERGGSTVETMEEGSGNGTNILMYIMVGTTLFSLFMMFLAVSVMFP